MKNDIVSALQSTSSAKWLFVARLIAGLPLLGLGIKHFFDLNHMKAILIASGIPAPELNTLAAPAGEIIAGLLLLSGLFARVGGLLGTASMVTAIYSTIVIQNLQSPPPELASIPFVPPLPLPVTVLIASLIILIKGAGGWSVDEAMTRRS